MMPDRPCAVEVFAPATVANLGPGFDILGMALETPFDTIRAERVNTPGVVIEAITGDGGNLPHEAEKNTAGIAALYVLRQLHIQAEGVCLTIHKGLPLASGLGSSAASAAGAAVAVNALFGSPLRPEELIPACVESEASVSGRHADNVAPALLGGIVLVAGLEADQMYRLPTPKNLILTLVTPAVAVPTAQARAVLPAQIPLKEMVRQSAAVALLITALHNEDIPLMGQAMEQDGIIEPARQHLMPGLHEVRAAARECGALGTIISGAGPTLCSICDSQAVAEQVEAAMRAVYDRIGIEAHAQVARPSSRGAYIKVSEVS